MPTRSAALLVTAALLWCQAAAEAGEGDDEVCRADGSCPSGGAAKSPFWKKRGGNDMTTSFTPHTAQTDFTVAPTWTWPNVDDEIQRHSASIDGEGNIYTVTAQGWVRKFTSDGQLLWSFRSEKSAGRILTDLNLHNGSIYFATTGNQGTGKQEDMGRTVGGWLFALGMDGKLLWQSALPDYHSEADSRTLFAADGVLLFSMRDPKTSSWLQGNGRVVASKVSDGSHLWDYDIGGVVWNFMPSSLGDGRVIFATNDGRAHCLDIATGKPIWKTTYPGAESMVYSTGGGALSPDGEFFYVAANYYTVNETEQASPNEVLQPCRPPKPVDASDEMKFKQGAVEFVTFCLPDPDCVITERCPDGPGLYQVYRTSDGMPVQQRRTKLMLNQYPAVADVNGTRTVLLSLGANAQLIIVMFMWMSAVLPSFLRWELVMVAIFKLQYHFAWVRRLLGIPIYRHNSVAAFDGDTGKPMWMYTEPPWDHFSSAGDEEGFVTRLQAMLKDDRIECLCGPDSWGIPVIAGDGTVYASSGLTGNLYAIQDKDGNGKIEPNEMSTFEAGQAFLNGPALAPGLLVASPCWGPMYVWRSSEA